MYILYGGDFTRSVLVQWVLEEAGLEYEFRKIDILKDEHRTTEFLAVDPAGLVGGDDHADGQALYETAAFSLVRRSRPLAAASWRVGCPHWSTRRGCSSARC